MFEQKITARDIMTSPVYMVQPTEDTQEEGGSPMRRMDDRRGRRQAEVERVGGASRRSLPAVDKNTRRERWSSS
jgi:hypothetical protein